MDILLLIALWSIGIIGLVKRQVKVSSKKEIVGWPVIVLSIFYIIAGAYILFIIRGIDLITAGIIALVTIMVIIFAKKQPILPKNPPIQV